MTHYFVDCRMQQECIPYARSFLKLIQLIFSCSKSTKEALEERVKYVQSSQEKTMSMSVTSVGVYIVNLEHISHHIFSVSIVNWLLLTGYCYWLWTSLIP